MRAINSPVWRQLCVKATWAGQDLSVTAVLPRNTAAHVSFSSVVGRSNLFGLSMDPRSREAALYFLRNISLDGQPPQGAGEVSGAEVRSKVARTTAPNHSSITTAIVHSGPGDLTQSDNASEDQGDSLAEDASDKSHFPPSHTVHPLSDAVKGRFTPAPQRGLSGSLKKQTHTSTDNQGNSSLELQRTR